MFAGQGFAKWSVLALLALVLCVGCGDDGDDGDDGKRGRDGIDGTDGADGAPGAPGAPGNVIDATMVSNDILDGLDVESEITGVTISSPPMVSFSVKTAQGVPISGIGYYSDMDSRFVRFTITKLVAGTNGSPDQWVAYVRDEDGEPTYDRGSLLDNGDGTYVFTFDTDVANVPGVAYEPTLTHRVAGQFGSRSVPIEAQNLWLDFVPAGGAVTRTRNIAVMESCNECHDDLVFHGRRFEVEYCVQCHNQDLTNGEGDMAFMIHKIHASGTFDELHGGEDYSHVTYPQDLENCRKCHSGDDAATAQGDNWKNVPYTAACDACHNVFATNSHSMGPQPDSSCAGCHVPGWIESSHATPNATPNNPELLDDEREMAYELISAEVDGSNQVIIEFKVLSDGTPIDVTNLPQDLMTPGRYPGFLLAWAETQDGITMPVDFTNTGMSAAQPLSLSLNLFSPIKTVDPIGTISYADGVNTATITVAASQFPVGAELRAVGLQGYFQQATDNGTISLHTPSAVATVDGDDARRTIVDNDKCASCHEWFEGHGGNRVYEIAICTLCHVPNLSSSGRSIDPTDIDEDVVDDVNASDPDRDGEDPLTYPEDTQNLKDMIHAIHSAAFRTTKYEHVRGGRQGYYDWSHVGFPAETNNCELCHKSGTYALPLSLSALPTTVRTTTEYDGDDGSTEDVEDAIDDVPNGTDWISTPTASTCYYCHDSAAAFSHMLQNGGLISKADGSVIVNRVDFVLEESCAVCHGPGKSADLEAVHSK